MRAVGILLLYLPAAALAVSSFTDTDRFLRSREKPKHYDRETLRREVSQTFFLIEALALQIQTARLTSTAEIWSTGEKDFHLPRGVVAACRQSCDLLIQALQVEKAGETAKAARLRDKARDKIRGFHIQAPESFLADLRGWLIVAEGQIRKSGDSEAVEAP